MSIEDLAKYRVQRKVKKPREKKPKSDYDRRYRKLSEKIRKAKHPAVLEYYTALRADLRLSRAERKGTKKARERQEHLIRLRAAYDEYRKRFSTPDACVTTETIGYLSMADLPFIL